MPDPRLYYQPRLAAQPEWVQAQIIAACKKLLRQYTDHWLLATIQAEGYFVWIVDLSMPMILADTVYLVTPNAETGRPALKAIVKRGP